MQPSTSSPPPADITKQRQRKRNRRRRRRNPNTNPTAPTAPVASLDVKDLVRDAHALEKQLQELQAQLSINLANIPKDQGRRANAIALQQVHATNDEMSFVRATLETLYQGLLASDSLYAVSQHIDDKLWRLIIYPRVEEYRQRLRKTSPKDPSFTSLLQEYHHRIDESFKYYRELNHRIKASFHVDTKTIGIDLFRQAGHQTEEDHVARLLQSNYLCMGDLARYRASIPRDGAAANDWAVSKASYQKAADVYRANGKPYSQLALISASVGSVIDVVCYYCMSMATKHPSNVGRDNLRSFYGKIRFASTGLPLTTWKPLQYVSHFVDAFLQMHQSIFFNHSDSYPAFSNGLSTAMTMAMTSLDKHDPLFQILRSTLTRSITILIISIWYMEELIRDKHNFSRRSEFQQLQMSLLAYGFQLLTDLGSTTINTEVDSKRSWVRMLAHNTVLPSLAIWCSYLSSNLDILAQYCRGSDGRTALTRDDGKRKLTRSIQTFCSFLIGHPTFAQPLDAILPSQYPLSEDVLLLGQMPLAPFHLTVDFFKESGHQVDDPTSIVARQQVRWGRIRDLVRKMSETSSFSFVQYNAVDQSYTVVDENAKRQQQGRFMKALAAQRLMEQVSMLEKDVDRLTVTPQVDQILTVVVDVTAFLDDLRKIKKWANLVLNTQQRTQTAILQVIVPLEVIDVLDEFKNGHARMNVRARESIRYLDQQLRDAKAIAEPPTHSYLRTQKMDETLGAWETVAPFWIGEHSRGSLSVEEADSEADSEDNQDQDVTDSCTDQDTNDQASSATDDLDSCDDDSSSSDTDLFRRRYADEEDMTDEASSDEEDDDLSDDDATSTASNTSAETDDDDAASTASNISAKIGVPSLSWQDVPKKHQAILNCLLYQQQQQPAGNASDQHNLVLVTNDEQLAWWAELFGHPSSGRRLSVHTVKEWDRLLSSMTVTSASKRRRRKH
ncbi:hypothetical protein DM01DRAFT_1350199 [Hesseltinella vesiculosa]|uniref:PIN domain-containing protein n=1 Tax=Hesseltinella vesiculosa TaxID=101127 RepID=A0A1X2G2F6_9FUNG|nr:hypothetical protein DM01DRAFT_1350199 [Hesseltinella vesiculosa]